MVTGNSFKFYKLIISFLLILVLTSCDKEQDVNVRADYPQVYLEGMLRLMKAEAVNRHTIDWNSFEDQVLKKASGAQTIEEVYPAIELALTLLGERHSFYKHKKGVLKGLYESCSAPNFTVPNHSEIGYIRISSFSDATTTSQLEAHAQEIQNTIRDTDSNDIKGWIVDLRGNNGGHMWPMLAGIGPILGDGTAGYFIDTNDNYVSWAYHPGVVSYIDKAKSIYPQTVLRLTNSYRLHKPDPKVAVLVNSRVASAGEAIFISFKERPNTRSFGSSTCGVSTNLLTYKFTDGAVLHLANAVMADRTKRKYGTEVSPDEVLPDEEAFLRAIEWIKED